MTDELSARILNFPGLNQTVSRNNVDRDKRRRRLTSQPFGGGIPRLLRHPDDGWRLARPFPMDPATLRSLRYLIDLMVPPAPAPRSENVLFRVEDGVRRMMSYFPKPMALATCLALKALDWAPVWRGHSPQRLHKLSQKQADAVIDGLWGSRFSVLRTLVFVVRGLIMSTYFDQPEVHRALDYAPVPFIRDRMSLRDRVIQGGRTTAEDLIDPARDVAREEKAAEVVA